MTARRKPKARLWGSMTLALSIGLGIFTAGMLSFAFEQLAQPLYDRFGFWLAIAVIAGITVIAWLFFYVKYESLQRLVRSEARELDNSDLTGRPYLITGFSPLSEQQLEKLEVEQPKIDLAKISELCANNDARTWLGGWQQSLRLLHFLQGKGGLKHVYIIDNGTGQIRMFSDLLALCFPTLTLHVLPHGAEKQPSKLRIHRNYHLDLDYESYDYVYAAFDHAFAEIAKESGLTRPEVEEAVYIDVTPGLKIFSIAAAIQTLNRGSIFLYVSSHTNSGKVKARQNGYEILGYDAQAQFRLTNE